MVGIDTKFDKPSNVPIVKVEHLWHRYSKTWALQDICFEVDREGILGLLGANGAGKSTFMNILCGVLYQTKGDVYVDGINIREQPLEAKKRIGFLPQIAPLHLELTVDEYLIHCAQLRRVAANDLLQAVEVVKDKCGLAHFSKRLIGNLSGGYRQRVGIAQAIVHNPEIVVLDEPTNGLDPNQISVVRQLINEIAQDRLVILSSHVLSEIEAVCDRIIMIDQGVTVFTGSVDGFRDLTEPHKLIMELGSPPTTDELLAIEGVEEVGFIDGKRIAVSFSEEHGLAERLVEASVTGNWRLQEISFERRTLEETFAQLSVGRVA